VSAQFNLIEPTAKEILRGAARELLARRVLACRDFRINPGGLIHYVALDREALTQRAEIDAADYASKVSAPTIQSRHDPVTGFWVGSLRWHSSE
jgi:hypothetical protein